MAVEAESLVEGKGHTMGVWRQGCVPAGCLSMEAGLRSRIGQGEGEGYSGVIQAGDC